MDVDTPTLGAKKAKKTFIPKLNKVFIKNLSAETTSEIQSVFGNLAPIRRCFVIQKDGKCTGIGYVHYAMEADAMKAVASLNHTKLNGRTLEVSIARPKNAADLPAGFTLPEPSSSAPSQSRKSKSSEPSNASESKSSKSSKPVEEDKDEDIATTVDITKSTIAQRTVVISGISDDVVYKQLLRKARKFGKMEALMYPAAEGTDVAYVMYHGADQAAAALSKLENGFSIGTKPVTVQMFSTTRINKFRIIVRNLPFKCTEANLREQFATFGEVLQVSIPAGDRPGQNRGFGFVTFTNLKAATKAVAESDKLKIMGRKVAVDLTVGRDQLRRQNEGPLAANSKMDVDQEDKDESEDAKSNESESSDEEAENSNDSESDDDDEKDKDNADDEEAWPTEVPEFESEDDTEEEEQKKEEEVKKRAFSSDVHLGQTLFLRNVAFDTTESELFDKFSEWGPLKHAKIVKDRTTGEARGTAFVHFVNSADADKCLKDAYRSHKFANHRKVKKSDDSDLQESDIQIGGRHLIVDVAVTRKSADKLTEERKEVRERKKSDKRNLGLAALSTLTQDQMAELTKEERDKYERGQHEKNMKLANPNYHVSRTRLCVRNLPKVMTEDGLRKLFGKAAGSVPGHIGFHQVKIVRDKERGNVSRGYGFVEFSDHVHALAALQEIHGKHQKYAQNNRLFVEFAVEDSRVLQAREFRLNKSKEEGFQTRKPKAPRTKKVSDDGEEEAENGKVAASEDGDEDEKPRGRKREQKNGKNEKKRKRSESVGTQDDETDSRRSASRNGKRDQNNGQKPNNNKRPKLSEDNQRSSARPHQGRAPSVQGVKKGAYATPAADSRRGAQSKSRQHEEALEKMIGVYQKSLDSGPKKRWFD